MIRTLNVNFSNEDYSLLEQVKEESGLGWREFILTLVKSSEKKEGEVNETKRDI